MGGYDDKKPPSRPPNHHKNHLHHLYQSVSTSSKPKVPYNYNNNTYYINYRNTRHIKGDGNQGVWKHLQVSVSTTSSNNTEFERYNNSTTRCRRIYYFQGCTEGINKIVLTSYDMIGKIFF